MAAFYSSHLAAISERLCLGHVSAMQDAMLLRQVNITHAVIICSHAQLRHTASSEELSVAEVLTWLLADAQLAQTVRSCAAAGVQAKLVLIDQPDKVNAWEGGLPALFTHSFYALWHKLLAITLLCVLPYMLAIVLPCQENAVLGLHVRFCSKYDSRLANGLYWVRHTECCQNIKPS